MHQGDLAGRASEAETSDAGEGADEFSKSWSLRRLCHEVLTPFHPPQDGRERQRLGGEACPGGCVIPMCERYPAAGPGARPPMSAVNDTTCR
jgi:hypothetical protein